MWSSVITQLADINTHGLWPYQDLWLQQLHGPRMGVNQVSGCYTNHSHQHGSRRQQNLRISPTYCNPDCLNVHEPQASSQSGAVAWTTDNNMSSGNNVAHSVLSGRSNLGSEPFLISGLHHFPEPGIPLPRDRFRICSRLLYIIPDPTGKWQHVDLLMINTIKYPVLPLSMAHASLHFSIFPTCPSHICYNGAPMGLSGASSSHRPRGAFKWVSSGQPEITGPPYFYTFSLVIV